jgi:uncharacterized protein YukE
MYLRVKYDSLNDTGKYFVQKSDELDQLVKEIRTLTNDLKQYWDGNDYKVFINTYNNRLREVTATSIELNAIGNALNKVSDLYSGVDNDFGKRVQSMRKEDYEK